MFVDLGIPSALVNCLNNASDSVIPQILRCIASIVLIDREEQNNFSNNEIWPTLEFILQNVSLFSSNSTHSIKTASKSCPARPLS